MASPICGDSSTMDLPKGIVEDDKRIYELLANEAEIPVAALIRVWKIYTILNRKLHDPTARRLENFFWHLYGGDRRHLKPRTISAIWESIAMGPTFVPLRGPPNRYEPPPPPPNVQPNNDQPEVEILPGELPKAVPEPSKVAGTPTVRELSASSTRPPPPHPILKKSRGDSKTGPRPTARFASPPDSEEDSRPSEDNSSGSAALELRIATNSATPPGKSTKRRAGTPTKKFVAASSASKRRPVLPRRPSSQSSTGSSELTSRNGASSAGSRLSGSQNGSLTSAAESPISHKSVDTLPEEEPIMSAKALGKQPATNPSRKDRRPPPHATAETPKVHIVSRKETPTPSALTQMNGAQRSTERRTSGPTSAPQAGTSFGSVGTTTSGGSRMERSSSGTEYPRARPTAIGRISSYGLLSNATASTTNIEAMGQLSATDDPALQSLHHQAASISEPDNPFLPRNSSTASFMPTLASPTPPVPLARPRSQLTLLLEKENAKGRPVIKARSKS